MSVVDDYQESAAEALRDAANAAEEGDVERVRSLVDSAYHDLGSAVAKSERDATTCRLCDNDAAVGSPVGPLCQRHADELAENAVEEARST